jgi:thymidylate synthase (FAD)
LLFYQPRPADFALQSPVNNQGRQEGAASAETYAEAMARWDRLRTEAASTYGWLVSQDVARELARIDLPLSTYTQWYWKIDLHNLLHFLSLRIDPHAQYEIRAYAEVIAGIVKRVAPLSYEAWVDYQVAGAELSYAELRAVQTLVERDGSAIRSRGEQRLEESELKQLGLSPREIAELLDKLQPRERPDFELDLGRMRPAEAVEQEMLAAVPVIDRELQA